MNHTVIEPSRHSARRLTFVLAAFLAVAVFAATLSGPSGTGATTAAAKQKKAKKTAKTKARLKILTGTQLGVITTGKVKAKVWIPSRKGLDRKAKKQARRASQSVKVSLTVTQSYGESVKVKPVRVKAFPYRSRQVTVKLPASAVRLIEDCGTPSLKLTAQGVKNRRHARWSKTATRKLSRFADACAVPTDVDLSKADTCDFIAPPGNTCMAPFPNDFYTRSDTSSETGKRIDLDPTATPKNVAGVNISVTELNQSDGFSPGPLISILVPGMDNQPAFDQSGIVPLAEMSRTYEPDQAVVLIDAETGQRQLIWGELDSTSTADKTRNLLIRPGKNLTEGRRYIVALRNIKRADGSLIEAPAGFRLYRDTERTDNQTIESRREHFESIFDRLDASGIERDSLYLAWDFTVASTENITGRMLSIRDRAFAELGDTNLTDGVVQGDAPEFTVSSSPDNPNAENARTVTGTFEVPCYLDTPGCPPGSTFNLDSGQDPIRIPGNTMTARFTCNIPKSAVNDLGGGNFEVVEPVRPSLYGHGLFGQYTETNTGNVRKLGTENGVMVCGTDWSGMASEDVALTAFPALLDLSKFNALPDRLQQGFLNFLFLGRLMIHADGFTDHPAFQFGGESVIDTSDLFYYGNSQGGIAGGALTAVATDFTRSVLYVPGMNYSTLLTRSSNFDTYQAVLYPRYLKQEERPLLFSIMQMLWDRGEPNGYANHMTSDPLPGTPAHKVMIQMAYGDHQVPNVATEVQARTIGAPLRGDPMSGVVSPNRHPAGLIEPFYGHDTLGDLAGPAADGNAFFVWDIGPKRDEGGTIYGTDPAPLTNTPPINAGVDPHDTVINESPLIRKQIADFLQTDGKVTNPCGSDPCWAADWMGFP